MSAVWFTMQRLGTGESPAVYHDVIPPTAEPHIIYRTRLDLLPNWEKELLPLSLAQLTDLYYAGKLSPTSPPLEEPNSREPLLQFFAFDHLPEALQEISEPFANLARHLCYVLPKNGQRDWCLAKLLEAKDCAV